MTPKRKRTVLRHRVRSLRKRQRMLKRLERRRRVSIKGLRLSQRLRLDLLNKKKAREKKREERKKKLVAKRETAKLNRTLKRRRIK